MTILRAAVPLFVCSLFPAFCQTPRFITYDEAHDTATDQTAQTWPQWIASQEHRADDLIKALAAPPTPGIAEIQSLLGQRGFSATTPAARKRLRQYLLGNLARMREDFLQAKEQARLNRSQMFQNRGCCGQTGRPCQRRDLDRPRSAPRNVHDFSYARVHNGFPKEMEADIRKGALKMIVFEELVYQEAVRRKMMVPQTRMDRAMMDFRKQFPNQDEYEKFLKTETNNSPQMLRTRVRRSILIEEMLKLNVDDKAVVSVAEARAYYDKNPDKFRIPDSLSLQTISILPPPNATPEQLKDVRKRAEPAHPTAPLGVYHTVGQNACSSYHQT